jgi:hypothetical protein
MEPEGSLPHTLKIYEHKINVSFETFAETDRNIS